MRTVSRPGDGAAAEFVSRSRRRASESLTDVIRDHLVAQRSAVATRSYVVTT